MKVLCLSSKQPVGQSLTKASESLPGKVKKEARASLDQDIFASLNINSLSAIALNYWYSLYYCMFGLNG